METTQELDAETARALRKALEDVAVKIEQSAANRTYEMAFKKAARIIREAKPD